MATNTTRKRTRLLCNVSAECPQYRTPLAEHEVSFAAFRPEAMTPLIFPFCRMKWPSQLERIQTTVWLGALIRIGEKSRRA